MNVGESIQIGDHLPFVHVEDDELVGVHMGDIQAVMGTVEALIVEANGWPGEWDVGDLGEWASSGGERHVHDVNERAYDQSKNRDYVEPSHLPFPLRH